MTLKPITVNCIGVGRWGPNVVRAFTQIPGVRVHWVCDLDAERLAKVQQNIPDIATTTCVDRVIEDVEADAIVIVTPVENHFEMTKRALHAGKHVLVEKPLCRTVAQCEEMISVARIQHRILAVGHVFLFNAGIQRVGQAIRAGELGRIFYLHATRTNLGPVRQDVNALWDLAAHDLSIFDYWLGQSPERVSATGRRFVSPGVDDVVTAHFTYPEGVSAIAYASWLNPRKVREITVVGERKMAVWNDMDPVEPVRIYNKSIDVDEHKRYSDSYGSFQATIRDGDVLVPRVSAGEPLLAECAHFVECIRTGCTPLNNAKAALAVVRSLAAADRSLSHDGRSVDVREDRLRQAAQGRLSDRLFFDRVTEAAGAVHART